MEALDSSDTSLYIYGTTRRHTPDDTNIRAENVDSTRTNEIVTWDISKELRAEKKAYS
jgi:hypothetical protein